MPAVGRLSPKEKTMPYCDICHSENCEHQDRSCPCGCGNNPRENCVYDTAQERHVKNMLNLKLDEQWVTDTLEMPCNTCGHSFSRHLTAGGFCKHCECVKFTRPTPLALDKWRGDSVPGLLSQPEDLPATEQGATPAAPCQ